MNAKPLSVGLLLICISIKLVLAAPLGSAFLYQGVLRDGPNLANGNYDVRLRLFENALVDAPAAGPVTNLNITVTNGVLVTAIDFGTNSFAGASRWLEIAVRPSGSSTDFTPLAPRQPVLPAPYSIFAATAGNLVGQISDSQLPAGVARLNADQRFDGLITFSPLSGPPFRVESSVKVSDLNAEFLDGIASTGFWKTSGNGGTIAGANFLGTTDDQPLELKANNNRVLRLEPDGTSPNIIGGHAANSVEAGIYGATIGGGGNSIQQNSIASSYGTVGGGAGNSLATSDYGTISGGQSNRLGSFRDFRPYGQWANIAGGRGNFVTTSFSSIAGGDHNTIDGDIGFGARASIGGGARNTINGGEAATISGGASNVVQGCGWGTIGGGQLNTNNGEWGTIGGGGENTIEGSCDDEYTSSYSTIGGGHLNHIGFIPFGLQGSTIAGGFNNRTGGAVTSGAVGGGANNLVNASYGTVPGGNAAIARSFGQFAYGSGQFQDIGDAQTSVYICRGTTTNELATELFLDGLFARMKVPTNSTWGFDMLVTGRASSGSSAAYQIRGTIKNGGGTTSIVPSPMFNQLGNDDPTWDVVVGADNAHQALTVKVIGTPTARIRWVASVRTVEVVY